MTEQVEITKQYNNYPPKVIRQSYLDKPPSYIRFARQPCI